MMNGGGIDVYILKLDSSGSFIWAKQIGGYYPTQTIGYDLDVDTDGNALITGTFIDSADFDPGIGIFKLFSNGQADVFISKLNLNGDFVWAKSFGNIMQDYAYSICTDNNGNVYTTGNFMDSVDFDPGTNDYILHSNGDFDIFISKLDSNGTFVWANSIGGVSSEAGLVIEADMNQNIYTTGYFNDSVFFNPPASNMLAS